MKKLLNKIKHLNKKLVLIYVSIFAFLATTVAAFAWFTGNIEKNGITIKTGQILVEANGYYIQEESGIKTLVKSTSDVGESSAIVSTDLVQYSRPNDIYFMVELQNGSIDVDYSITFQLENENYDLPSASLSDENELTYIGGYWFKLERVTSDVIALNNASVDSSLDTSSLSSNETNLLKYANNVKVNNVTNSGTEHPLSSISHYPERESLNNTTTVQYYRLTCGYTSYSSVYTGQTIRLRASLYVAQQGALTDIEVESNTTSYITSIEEFNDFLANYKAGDTIKIQNNITYAGDLVIRKPFNMYVNGAVFTILGNLIYDFPYNEEYFINTTNSGTLLISSSGLSAGNLEFKTPNAEVHLIGKGKAATTGDAFVRGNIYVNASYGSETETGGLLINGFNAYESTADGNIPTSSFAKKIYYLEDNTKIEISSNTSIDEIWARVSENESQSPVKIVKVINYGELRKVRFTSMTHDLSIVDKPQIYFDNYGDYGTDSDNKIELPQWSMPFLPVGSGGNTRIIQEETSTILSTKLATTSAANTNPFQDIHIEIKRVEQFVIDVNGDNKTIIINYADNEDGTTNTIESILKDYYFHDLGYDDATMTTQLNTKLAEYENLTIASYQRKELTVADMSIIKKCSNLEYLDTSRAYYLVTTKNGINFKSMSKLTTVKLSENLQTLDNNTFENCSLLKEITVPASVNSLSPTGKWYVNSGIKYIHFKNGGYVYSGLQNNYYYFVDDDLVDLYRNQYFSYPHCFLPEAQMNEEKTCFYRQGSDGLYELVLQITPLIPDSNDVTLIEKVKINSSLYGSYSSIGDYAFYSYNYQSNLNTKIKFGDSVKTIGCYNFYNKGEFISIDLNNTLYVKDYCFSKSVIDNLDASNLVYAGNNAFQESSLFVIDFSSLDEASTKCFYKCLFNNTFSMPSLRLARSYCFDSCNLANITSFPSLLSVDDHCFYLSKFSNISFNSLKTANNYAFQSANFNGTLSMPSLQTATEGCFYGCALPEIVSLPSLNSAGYFCFYSCNTLKELRMENLSTVGENAIYSLSNIETLYCPNLSYFPVRNGAYIDCIALLPKLYDLYIGVAYTWYQNAFINSLTSLRYLYVCGTSIDMTKKGSTGTPSQGMVNVDKSICKIICHEDIKSYITTYMFSGCTYLTVDCDAKDLKLTGTYKGENNEFSLNHGLYIVKPNGANASIVAFCQKTINDDNYTNDIFSIPSTLTTFDNTSYTITELSDYAFKYCTINIGQFILSNTITKIGNYCFSADGYSKTIDTFTAYGLINAGNYSFEKTLFDTFDAPSLTTIGDYGFQYCEFDLATSFTSLYSAGTYCFRKCKFKVTTTFNLLNDVGTYCFTESTFNAVTFTGLEDALDYCFYKCSFVTLSFPQLKTAGQYCFAYCAFPDSVSMPSLLSAQTFCFCSCSNIKELRLPSLTHAYQHTFYNMSLLETLYCPSLTNYYVGGTSCYVDCITTLPKLYDVYIGLAYSWQQYHFIRDLPSVRYIYVCGSSIDMSKKGTTGDAWNNMSSINKQNCQVICHEDIKSYITTYMFIGCTYLTIDCDAKDLKLTGTYKGENNELTLNHGLYIVKPNGTNASIVACCRKNINDEVYTDDDFTISSSITTFDNSSYTVNEILDYGFKWCTIDIGEIILPNTLTKIGNYCFSAADGYSKTIDTFTAPRLVEAGNYAFERIIFDTFDDSSLTTVGDYAFQYCEFDLANTFTSLVTVGDYAFRSAKIKGITTFNSLRNVGTYCFNGANFKNVTFTVLEDASDYCFKGASFETLSFPELENAGTYCFANCTFPDLVSIPSLLSAQRYCFSNCETVKELRLESLTHAYQYAFYSLNIVETIYCPNLSYYENLTEDHVNCFYDNPKLYELHVGIAYTWYKYATINNNPKLRYIYVCGSSVDMTKKGTTGAIGNELKSSNNSQLRVICHENLLSYIKSYMYHTDLATFITVNCDAKDLKTAGIQFGVNGNLSLNHGKYIIQPDSVGSNAKIIQMCDTRIENTNDTSIYTVPTSLTAIDGSIYNITELYNDAYRYTSIQIDDFVIPSSITKVGDYCFDSHSGFTKIIGTFTALGVLEAGNYAFQYGLYDDFNTPLLGTVGDYAFQYCEINQTNNFSSLISAGTYAFRSAKIKGITTYNSLKNVGTYCFNGTNFKNVTFTVLEDASDYCFKGASFETLSFPKLKTAEVRCFENSVLPESVSMPSLQSAQEYCFYNSDTVKELRLESLTNAYRNTFAYMDLIETLYCPNLSYYPTCNGDYINCISNNPKLFDLYIGLAYNWYQYGTINSCTLLRNIFVCGTMVDNTKIGTTGSTGNELHSCSKNLINVYCHKDIKSYIQTKMYYYDGGVGYVNKYYELDFDAKLLKFAGTYRGENNELQLNHGQYIIYGSGSTAKLIKTRSETINTSSSSTDVYSIPGTMTTLDGYTYTINEIADNAFRHTKIETGELIIPSSVIKVGNYSFDAQTTTKKFGKLTALGLTEAGTYSFRSNTISGWDVPLLEKVGDFCFYSTHFTITNPISFTVLDTIGNYCFKLSTFNSVSFPALVNLSNKTNCFEGSTFVNASFPALTSTGTAFFKSCTFTAFSFPVLTTPGESCFESCVFPSDVSIPSITSVSKYCFKDCDTIVNLKLENVTYASKYSFYSLDNVETIYCPKLSYYPTNESDVFCFSYCNKLVEVWIGIPYDWYQFNVFIYCSSIRFIYICGTTFDDSLRGQNGSLSHFTNNCYSGVEFICNSALSTYVSTYVTNKTIYTVDCDTKDIFKIIDGNNKYVCYINSLNELCLFRSLYGVIGTGSSGETLDLTLTYTDSNSNVYRLNKICDNAFRNTIIKTQSIIIPSTVNYVGSYSFFNTNNTITKLIHSGTGTIGQCAFRDNNQLTTINLIGDIDTIEINAFMRVSNATITIGYTTAVIPETNAFNGGSNNSLSVYALLLPNYQALGTWNGIPSSRMSTYTSKYIESSTGNVYLYDFINATDIRIISVTGTSSDGTLTIPSTISGNTVTQVMSYALKEYGNLVTLVLPSNLEKFDLEVGQLPSTLAAYSIDASNTVYYTDSEGVLYSKDRKVLISYPKAKTSTSYTVDNDCDIISSHAFDGSVYLTSITINQDVYVLDYAFANIVNTITVSFTSTTNVSVFVGYNIFENVFDYTIDVDDALISQYITNVLIDVDIVSHIQ